MSEQAKELKASREKPIDRGGESVDTTGRFKPAADRGQAPASSPNVIKGNL